MPMLFWDENGILSGLGRRRYRRQQDGDDGGVGEGKMGLPLRPYVLERGQKTGELERWVSVDIFPQKQS